MKTATEFLIDYFEIEPERFEDEGDVCLCEMIEAEVCFENQNLEEVVDFMNQYAEYYHKMMSKEEK